MRVALMVYTNFAAALLLSTKYDDGGMHLGKVTING